MDDVILHDDSQDSQQNAFAVTPNSPPHTPPCGARNSPPPCGLRPGAGPGLYSTKSSFRRTPNAPANSPNNIRHVHVCDPAEGNHREGTGNSHCRTMELVPFPPPPESFDTAPISPPAEDIPHVASLSVNSTNSRKCFPVHGGRPRRGAGHQYHEALPTAPQECPAADFPSAAVSLPPSINSNTSRKKTTDNGPHGKSGDVSPIPDSDQCSNSIHAKEVQQDLIQDLDMDSFMKMLGIHPRCVFCGEELAALEKETILILEDHTCPEARPKREQTSSSDVTITGLVSHGSMRELNREQSIEFVGRQQMSSFDQEMEDAIGECDIPFRCDNCGDCLLRSAHEHEGRVNFAEVLVGQTYEMAPSHPSCNPASEFYVCNIFDRTPDMLSVRWSMAYHGGPPASKGVPQYQWVDKGWWDGDGEPRLVRPSRPIKRSHRDDGLPDTDSLGSCLQCKTNVCRICRLKGVEFNRKTFQLLFGPMGLGLRAGEANNIFEAIDISKDQKVSIDEIDKYVEDHCKRIWELNKLRPQTIRGWMWVFACAYGADNVYDPRKVYEWRNQQERKVDYRMQYMLLAYKSLAFVLNAIYVAVHLVESLPEHQRRTPLWHYSSQGNETTFIIEVICQVNFTLELLMWIIAYPYWRKRGCLGVLSCSAFWVGVMSIVPFYVMLIVAPENRGGSARGDWPKLFMFVRLPRLIRVLRLIRSVIVLAGKDILKVPTVPRLLQALRMTWLSLVWYFLLVLSMAMISSTLLWYAELEETDFDYDVLQKWVRRNDSRYDDAGKVVPLQSIPETIWWAIVTLTTVGYGDYSPLTRGGKAVAGMTMMCGAVMMAMPVIIIGGIFQQINTTRQTEMRDQKLCRDFYNTLLACRKRYNTMYLEAGKEKGQLFMQRKVERFRKLYLQEQSAGGGVPAASPCRRRESEYDADKQFSGFSTIHGGTRRPFGTSSPILRELRESAGFTHKMTGRGETMSKFESGLPFGAANESALGRSVTEESTPARFGTHADAPRFESSFDPSRVHGGAATGTIRAVGPAAGYGSIRSRLSPKGRVGSRMSAAGEILEAVESLRAMCDARFGELEKRVAKLGSPHASGTMLPATASIDSAQLTVADTSARARLLMAGISEQHSFEDKDLCPVLPARYPT